MTSEPTRPQLSQRTVHVNAASTATQPDGSSWTSAFKGLQQALATDAAEIWVAAGSYSPGTTADATFQLKAGQAVYGGFAGTESQREARDVTRHRTVLDGGGVAHHVVIGADDAVLDGFTIRGGHGETQHETTQGNAGDPLHLTPETILAGTNTDAGAGMLNFQVAPVIRHCIFEDNSAAKGGAAYNAGHSSTGSDRKTRVPLFAHCTFRRNTATARGGAISNDLGVDTIFLDCVFEANRTDEKGGGMYNDFACSPLLLNCLFTGNEAASAGGIGCDGGSSPVMRNCSFTANRSTDFGAGVYLGTGPANDPVLVDCVIADNVCPWDPSVIYLWHDNRPRSVTLSGDAGYRAGRWTEQDIDRLRTELDALRVAPEPAVTPPSTTTPQSTRVVFVDGSRPSGGDGTAWTSAYASLSAALEDAGKDGAEIRVAAGVYSPGSDRNASFVLQPGVRVQGGYRDGVRDATAHRTVLDGQGVYHVVTGANGAVLDGFTITGGRADGQGYDGKGGGLVNYRRGPQNAPRHSVATGYSTTVRHCIFIGNSARDGGAVYTYDRAAPVFENCTFTANSAENGGAVLDRVGVTSTFSNCAFDQNLARWRGGALYLDYGARAKFSGCSFTGNATGGHGGALFSVSRASQLEYTGAELTGCKLDSNAAAGDGGAIDATDFTRITLTDCSFAGNTAGRSGDDILTDSSSSLTRSG